MPFFSNIPHLPTFRICLVAGALLLLTPLLLHPSVPQALRRLQELGVSIKMQNIGYLAHILAYFVASLSVLAILQPRTVEQIVISLTTLLAHGIATEVSQMWIPARDFDTLDLLCNLVSVMTAGIVWYWRSKKQLHADLSLN